MKFIIATFLIHVASTLHLPTRFLEADERFNIAVPDLYEALALEDIPTTFEAGIVLVRSNETRYGYQFGRPPDTMLRILKSPAKIVLKPLFGKVLNNSAPFHHWGLLFSFEPPSNRTNSTEEVGHIVPRPENGIVFELRNSANTGLIYLDVKRWENYTYRPEMVKFLGTLNRTDIELVNIGRAYIQHVGRKGFHDFYRNCQIFTQWYASALWVQPQLPTRMDQLLGKFIWWFKDWSMTARWVWKKVINFLGFSNNGPEVDSSAAFVPVDQLVQYHRAMNESEHRNAPEG